MCMLVSVDIENERMKIEGTWFSTRRLVYQGGYDDPVANSNLALVRFSKPRGRYLWWCWRVMIPFQIFNNKLKKIVRDK